MKDNTNGAEGSGDGALCSLLWYCHCCWQRGWMVPKSHPSETKKKKVPMNACAMEQQSGWSHCVCACAMLELCAYAYEARNMHKLEASTFSFVHAKDVNFSTIQKGRVRDGKRSDDG